MALVIDTGPLFASLDRRDPHYLVCRRLLEETVEPLVVPAPVVCEMDYWIRKELHPGVLVVFLDAIIDGGLLVEDLIPADYQRIQSLCEQYSDLDIGFVDASVLAVVERLNEPKLATLDHRHFRMLRPRHVEALQLLPE